MASVQKKNDAYYCQFVYLGKRYTMTVGRVSEAEARNFAGSVETVLTRLKQKFLHLPPGLPITEFVAHGGRPPEPVGSPQAAPTARVHTLSALKEKYLTAHSGGAMEENSLATVRTHLSHFERTFGPDLQLHTLTLADLQRYVTERRQKQYRGKPLSPVTLRKEVASLRAAWNWGALHGLTAGSFPGKGLVYPKGDEKPPFMTFEEVTRQVESRGLRPEQAEELWDSLYLRREEIDEFLRHVKGHATAGWVYPLVCAAAHLGARRSELLAVNVADVNPNSGTVLIREKKRSRRQRTTRTVPLTPFLADVLKEWIRTSHPGGPKLFAQPAVLARSKTRGRTTGHTSGAARPGSQTERMATVRPRAPGAPGGVTRDEAHDHFKRTTAGSKWAVVRGYHVLRHSYISCLAAAGVDQRIIDDAVGHQTDEQRKRYRHLVPDVVQRAVAHAFGG